MDVRGTIRLKYLQWTIIPIKAIACFLVTRFNLYHILCIQSLTERTRQLVSPTPDKELHYENANLNEELQGLKHQLSHLDQLNKSLKDSKTALEKQNEESHHKNKNLELENQVTLILRRLDILHRMCF